MGTESEVGTTAEGALQLPSAAIIEAFARHVPGAIYIYRRFPSGHACVDYISDGIADIYGYTPAELYDEVELGHSRIHPDDRPRFEASVEACFQSHEPWQCEYRVVLPERGVRYVSAAATLEAQDDGSVIWIGHLIDVTEFAIARHRLQEETARAREEAVAASASKSNFIAHVSHELRTPLHGVIGLSELIAADGAAPEHVRQQAGEIHKAGDHLLRLIADVIDLSAIEAGRLTLSVEPLCVATVVEEVVRMAQPIAKEHGIALFVDEELRGRHRVLADGTRLRQVLLNLLSNGIKYNRPRGRVSLRMLPAADTAVRIGVEDTGRGLDPAAIARLFAPFDRLGHEMGTIEGSGIGLVIAKNLAEAMHGALGVESRVGSGSTFWLELPRTFEQPQTSGAAVLETGASRASWPPLSLHVLVAEDNQLSREVFNSQLHKLGCSAHLVEDGALAWAAWCEGGYDFVITDVHMPGVSGFELTQRIRASEIGQDEKRTYIIGASANAMKEAGREAVARGMDDYITKPVSLGELRAALSRGQQRRDRARGLENARSRSPTPAASAGGADAAAGDVRAHRSADATPSATPTLDLTALEEISDGERAVVDELLLVFVDSAQSCVAELAQGQVSGDGAPLERAAHKLKSSARTVGAVHLGDLCERAEAAAADRDWAVLEQLRPCIVTEFERVKAAVAAQTGARAAAEGGRQAGAHPRV